jgi:hypothetical protein
MAGQSFARQGSAGQGLATGPMARTQEAGMRYEFSLKGLTPLLMHADDINFADELSAWRQDPTNKGLSKAGDDRSPAWTWLGGVYHSEECVALPSDNLAVAVRQAGAKLTMKGKKTFKEESVSGMFFEDEFLPLEIAGKTIPTEKVMALREESEFPAHLKAAQKMGFELFVKRAAVGMSKHVRVRAKFSEWACKGVVMVESEALKPEVLSQLFALAGRVGVGSWRPGGKTPGRYGMFAATLKPIK